MVFLITLFFYSAIAQVITAFASIGFGIGLILYKLKRPFLTSLYMTTVPPFMFGVIILLVGGDFNQGLGIATSAFLSFIVFRDQPKFRWFVIGFGLLMYLGPTLYINIYGPVLGTINIAFDEILVFLASLCWLSLTFFMYDEKKTRVYTNNLETKNKFLRSNEIKLRQVQKDLELQNTELEELNRRITLKNQQIEEFTYMATHDLKAPINNINAIAGQLKSNINNLQVQETETYLQYLQTSSKRMLALVSNLLENAKIGNSEFQNRINTNQIVQEILEDFSEKIKSSKAIIHVQNLPYLNCYPLEMRLVFQNLIDNALKFVPENKIPVIDIGYSVEPNCYKFHIADNGIGISEKEIGTIFNAFHRIHSKKEYEGSGIGLYGCKKVIHNHHGEIWVESKIHKGTTFYFTLPKINKEQNFKTNNT